MLHTTFRQLEVFVAVVDAGSFVAGADRLGITQPAVSNHIRSLEAQVGCVVLERRRGTSCVLTEEGRNLYDRALQLLDNAEKLASELPRGLRRQSRTQLKVWTQLPIMMQWLRPVVVEFMRGNPDVELGVELGSFETVVQQIRDREVDIAYFLGHGETAEFASEVVHTEPHGIFAPADHPSVLEFQKNPEALRDLPLILPKRNSHFFRVIDKCLMQAGIDRYSVACEVRDAPIIRELILSGHVGSMFHYVVEDDVKSGKLVQLVELPAMEFRQVYQPRATCARVAGHFAAEAREAFARSARARRDRAEPPMSSLIARPVG
ncbi:LysR family transcriptional regulator [Maritimibacter sp. DP1N21-5]|jgi:DNA-binding transcriptional LysR family regulator|uniref:LysR family transcriptional regulator n=1 Tax=Maritimibacter sp. DP1N21-5 TaxID=2836867 RepID=UPI000AE191D8|nr:LysR family transcriptional regulator [Maritimibacter sp. DP1N21-5]MBV7411114.1 LysR family transcriptional regulator [Maritimibacter sp. DP1N21-5]